MGQNAACLSPWSWDYYGDPLVGRWRSSAEVSAQSHGNRDGKLLAGLLESNTCKRRGREGELMSQTDGGQTTEEAERANLNECEGKDGTALVAQHQR